MLRSDAAEGNTSSTCDKLLRRTAGATDERLTRGSGKKMRVFVAVTCNFYTTRFRETAPNEVTEKEKKSRL